MGRVWTRNEINRGIAAGSVEKVTTGDLEAAEMAFEATAGDFPTRFRATVQAAVASGLTLEAERHVRIPEDYERLGKDELDALVRPFTNSFLRSQPTRAELLDAVREIDHRQRQHALWAPYIMVDPLPPEPRISTTEQLALGAEEVRARRAAYEALRQEYYDDL
jgi:hypothetical protein